MVISKETSDMHLNSNASSVKKKNDKFISTNTEHRSPISELDASFSSVETGYSSLCDSQPSPGLNEKESCGIARYVEIKSEEDNKESKEKVMKISNSVNNNEYHDTPQPYKEFTECVIISNNEEKSNHRTSLPSVSEECNIKLPNTKLLSSFSKSAEDLHQTTNSEKICQPPEYHKYISTVLQSVNKSQHFLRLRSFYSSIEHLARLEKNNDSAVSRNMVESLYEKLERGCKTREFFWLGKHHSRLQWKKEDDRGLRLKNKSVEDLKKLYQNVNKRSKSCDYVKMGVLSPSLIRTHGLSRSISVASLVSKYNNLDEFQYENMQNWATLWQPARSVPFHSQAKLKEDEFTEKSKSFALGGWKELRVSHWVMQTTQSENQASKQSITHTECYEVPVTSSSPSLHSSGSSSLHVRSASESLPSGKLVHVLRPWSIAQGSNNSSNSLFKMKHNLQKCHTYEEKHLQSHIQDHGQKTFSSTLEIIVSPEIDGRETYSVTKTQHLLTTSGEISAPQSPRTCYSLAYSSDSEPSHSSSTERQCANNLLLLLQPAKENDNANEHISLESETKISSSSETGSTNVSVKTDIYLGQGIHSKVEYFEKQAFQKQGPKPPVRSLPAYLKMKSIQDKKKSFEMLSQKVKHKPSSLYLKRPLITSVPFRTPPIGLKCASLPKDLSPKEKHQNALSKKITTKIQSFSSSKYICKESQERFETEHSVHHSQTVVEDVVFPRRILSCCDIRDCGSSYSLLHPHLCTSSLNCFQPHYVPERTVSNIDLRASLQDVRPFHRMPEKSSLSDSVNFGSHESRVRSSGNLSSKEVFQNDRPGKVEEVNTIEKYNLIKYGEIKSFYLKHIKTGSVLKTKEKFESMESLNSRSSSLERSRSLPRNTRFFASSPSSGGQKESSVLKKTEYGVYWHPRVKPSTWGSVKTLCKKFESMDNMSFTGRSRQNISSYEDCDQSQKQTGMKPENHHILSASVYNIYNERLSPESVTYESQCTPDPVHSSRSDLNSEPFRMCQSSPDISIKSGRIDDIQYSSSSRDSPDHQTEGTDTSSPHSSITKRIQNLISRFEKQKALQNIINRFESKYLRPTPPSSKKPISKWGSRELRFSPQTSLSSSFQSLKKSYTSKTFSANSSVDNFHRCNSLDKIKVQKNPEAYKKTFPQNYSQTSKKSSLHYSSELDPEKKVHFSMPASIVSDSTLFCSTMDTFPHKTSLSHSTDNYSEQQKNTRCSDSSVPLSISANSNQPGSSNSSACSTEPQIGPPPPLPRYRNPGFPSHHNPKTSLYSASPHRYQESEVNIHYRSPIRNLEKEYIDEEELRKRQEDAMRKFYEEERFKKHLQHLAEIEMRRHSDYFIPSQKSPIPLNRYDNPFEPSATPPPKTPEPRTLARAIYSFTAQTARELSLNKSDIVYITKKVDKNWYEGEHHGMIGIFPVSYVEIIPAESANLQPRKATEGVAYVRYNFRAQTPVELSLFKGEQVILVRRVDQNWYEGRIGTKRGIFPTSYIEVKTEPGETGPPAVSPKPPASPVFGPIVNGSQRSCQSQGPTYSTGPSPYPKCPPVPQIMEEKQPVTQSLHIDTCNEPIPYRALYSYRPQNDDELELRESDTVYVMEKCDDGWYVGTSLRTGLFGTFPGNYVERI